MNTTAQTPTEDPQVADFMEYLESLSPRGKWLLKGVMLHLDKPAGITVLSLVEPMNDGSCDFHDYTTDDIALTLKTMRDKGFVDVMVGTNRWSLTTLGDVVVKMFQFSIR